MPKAKICISIDPDLLTWIDTQIKIKRISSRSHAFEDSIHEIKTQHQKKIKTKPKQQIQNQIFLALSKQAIYETFSGFHQQLIVPV